VRYGSFDATLDREQGSNVWLTFAMREGKNREVKNVLGHLGLKVNRLIRVSFGPFQLGELAEGAVEEIKTRVLRDQLGERIVTQSGADFSGPIQEREAPEGSQIPGSSRGEAKWQAGAEGKRPPLRKPGIRHSSELRPARKRSREEGRRRDQERFGEPELARREKRRGHWRPRGSKPPRTKGR
jgi:23S rRNA pseudouridine2605 synthase